MPHPATDSMVLQALESAAFAAWPAEQSEDVQGWHLRLDRGYTKRANSANATALAQHLPDTQISALEARFRQRGLRPVFRFTSFAPVQELDALLAGRGYQQRDASLVMTRSLLPAANNSGLPPRVARAADWLQAFAAIAGQVEAEQAVHLDILQRIAHPCAWAVERGADGRPVCCGLGVRVATELGIFDVATRADHRRQGHARRLILQILAWGRQQGASQAFLQVIAANRAAVALYEALGFQPAYAYWYRVAAG